MQTVYVAGLYSKNPDGTQANPGQVQANIAKAKVVARKVWQLGHAALSPHANTEFLDGDPLVDWNKLIRGDLRLMGKCDVLVVLPGWQGGRGTWIEVTLAQILGKKVFECSTQADLEAFYDWLKVN